MLCYGMGLFSRVNCKFPLSGHQLEVEGLSSGGVRHFLLPPVRPLTRARAHVLQGNALGLLHHTFGPQNWKKVYLLS